MINKKIKNFIKLKSEEHFPQEACGFIIKDKEDFECIDLNNISNDPLNTFQISSLDFLKIKNKYKDIYYIYHSHTNENDNFSILDKNCSNNLLIPIILYVVKFNIFKIYELNGKESIW
jgi:proteasome lid subunit RPN8/RPN11